MAQIDPNIALGIRQLQMRDPLEAYSNVLAAQGAQQQNALMRQQLDAYTEDRSNKLKAQNALRSSAERGLRGEDLEQDLLNQGHVDLADAIRKSRLDAEGKKSKISKERSDTNKSDFETLQKQLESFTQLSRGVTDQAGYDQALSLASMFMPLEAMAKIPRQYSPEVVAKMQQFGISNLQQLQDLTTRRGQDFIDARSRSEGAANRAVTMRGQDMVDAREREAPRGVPLETGNGPVLVNPRTGESMPITVGGRQVPAKQPEFAKKETAGIDAQNYAIDGALKAVEKTPSAFGFTRGLATQAGNIPESLAQKASSNDEIQARSFVFNNVSKIINERAGAAQSAQELARLRGFLPADTDDARVIAAKLNGFKEYLSEQRKAYAPAAAPSGGFRIIGVE